MTKWLRLPLALEVLFYQLWCSPVACGPDLKGKFGNLLRREAHVGQPEDLSPDEPTDVTFVFGPGWHQDNHDMEPVAQFFARNVKAHITYVRLPEGEGHIETYEQMSDRNVPLLEELLADPKRLVVIVTYSRLGPAMLLTLAKLARKGVDLSRVRVFCLAAPVLGSYHGLAQVHAMRVLAKVVTKEVGILKRGLAATFQWGFPRASTATRVLLRPAFLAAVEAASEMVPLATHNGCDASNHRVCGWTREARAAGAKIWFFAFYRDGLVMRRHGAPCGEKPHMIKESSGHCSISNVEVLKRVLLVIRQRLCEEGHFI